MEGECPECGRDLSGDEKFCMGCGCDLTSARPSVCPECDQELSGDERYCFSCGHDLNADHPAGTSQPNSSGSQLATGGADGDDDAVVSRRLALGVVGGGVLGGGGVLAAMQLSSDDEQRDSARTGTRNQPATSSTGSQTGRSTDTSKTVTRTATQIESELIHYGLTPQEYDDHFEEHTEKGHRLTLVSGYTVDSDPRFATIWTSEDDRRWIAHRGLTNPDYQNTFDKLAEDGMRPVHISGYEVGSEYRRAVIWEPQLDERYWVRSNRTAAAFESYVQEYRADNFRLVHISGCGVDGLDKYAGIWVDTTGPPWEAYWDQNSNIFQDTYQTRTEEGYRPTVISGYTVDNYPLFASIWVQSDVEWSADIDLSEQELAAQHGKHSSQGLKLSHLSGYGINDEARYAAIWSDT